MQIEITGQIIEIFRHRLSGTWLLTEVEVWEPVFGLGNCVVFWLLLNETGGRGSNRKRNSLKNMLTLT